MADRKIILFIDALIAKTKNKEMIWSFLDENKALYERMGWCEYDFIGNSILSFDVESSFYTKAKDGTYVVLYVADNAPATLYVIPRTFRMIRCLEAVDYGRSITRLFNIVQSQFPSADKFISEFSLDGITEV